MRITTLLLPVIGIVLCFLSCIKEDSVIQEIGDDAYIFVTAAISLSDVTRGYGEPDDADDKIEQFRILAFKSNGTLVYNEVTDISVTKSHKVELLTGTYDFVFIGNEDYETNSTLTNQLNALVKGTSTFADIAALSFPAKAFDNSLNIPMSRVIKNVKILGGSRYEIGGIAYDTVWKVSMKRLGVRLDIKITTESQAKAQSFSKLNIKNIPVNVPILEEDAAGNKLYNGGPGKFQATPKVINASQGDNGGSFGKPSGSDTYQWSVSRVILPSSIFEQDTEANAMTLECVYNSNETSAFAIETKIDNLYQVPRNTYIKASMSFSPTLEIYIDTEDWDNLRLDESVGAVRTLNVSGYTSSITQATRERIWFSSNMKNVYVNTTTANGQLVNTYFKDLAGTSATNLHYTYDESTRTGTGFIDIMTSDNYKGGNNTYKIYLNASGLQREITVNVTSGGGATDKIGYFEYVGAFWRNSQKGERVIAGESNGAWRAEVDFGRDWAVLDAGRSLDKNIYTANHGDAEDFPVNSSEYVVTGTGQVFFRIGAKSTQPEGSQPRYGRVILTYNNNSTTAYIYLRQGEEADYLMRPGDLDGQHPDRYQRVSAAKFSPYNITSSTLASGGSAHMRIGIGAGVEVQYPTQAGAFFHFVENSSPVYAYNPVSPTGTISSFGNTASAGYWGNLPSQDVCPPNYRRPKNGKTNDQTGTVISESEIAQSLWLNQSAVVTNTSISNALFGYYADGYFDRKKIESPETGFNNMIRTAVSPKSPNVGFAGCLFFNPNPDSYASIFFPCPGYRNTDGRLWYTGRDGYYLTDTGSSTASAHTLFIQSPTIEKNGYMSRTDARMMISSSARKTANSLRCVKE